MVTIFLRILSYAQNKIDYYQKLLWKSRLAKCGYNVDIHATCNILSPHNLEVGDNSSIGAYTTIFAGFGVTIGKNCLISSSCGISTVNHLQEAHIRYTDASAEATGSKPVIIGNNVWMGMNCCILPGIIIGNNSIIGAGSVVTKNIPANEIWVGNPARFVKTLNLPIIE